MNDQEQVWLEQARAGDRQAFSHLVEAYQRPVFSLTYRMLGDPEEAEDAAQEAFFRAYTRLGQYDPQHKFSTWLFSIANHHCIDRLRRRRVTWMSIDDNPEVHQVESTASRPEEVVIEGEQAREIQSLLETLEPDYRTPLILRYWQDCSYQEIADTMGITVAAVKTRLFRARQKMAAVYQEAQVSPMPAEPRHAGQDPDKRPALRSAFSLQSILMGGLTGVAGG
jgi:RNA polymerase sigma-70 factor, ECF subfamily